MSRMARGILGICALVFALWLSALLLSAQPTLPGPAGTNAAPVAPGPPAQSAPPLTVTSVTNQALSDSRNEVLLKEVQPGIFQLGDIKINKRQRTVRFPAVINLRRGQIEYFLVNSWGKVHESILRTDTEPYRIHVAMLLLGAKGAGTNEDDTANVPDAVISHPSSVRPPGDAVTLEIEWLSKGKLTRKSAGELIFNSKSKSALRKGDWVYNGSLMAGTSFLAQREGSIVSLVTDPEALINNAAPGHDDDTLWTPNTNRLPSATDSVEVIIKLINQKPERKR